MTDARDRVLINDITLRDGEQAPGICFLPEEKLQIARKLVDLRVAVIEAGFAVASDADFQGVHLIARELGGADGPVICSMARAHPRDIEAAARALEAARRPRIQVVLSTSDLHIERKLGKTRAEVLELAHTMTARARALVDDVEFAAEDATRSDPAYLHQVFAAALGAGARTLEIPDTVGYATPDEYGALVRSVIEHVPGAREAVIATHCHDDLGLATANTLAGIQAGARQAEVTINGVGERAGNACFEEVVMALVARSATYRVDPGIDTRHIVPASALVSRLSGFPVAPNKAVVGGNAFAHESGIHQHGVLCDVATYQILDPASVGAAGIDLRLGKLSGRHAVRFRLEQLGREIDDAGLERVYAAFIERSGTKHRLTDADLLELLERDEKSAPPAREASHG